MPRVSAAIDLIYDFVVEHMASVDEKRYRVEYDDPVVRDVVKLLLVLRWAIDDFVGLEFIDPPGKNRLLVQAEERLNEVRKLLRETAERIRLISEDAAEALTIIAEATREELKKYRFQLGIHNDVLVRRWKEKNPLG